MSWRLIALAPMTHAARVFPPRVRNERKRCSTKIHHIESDREVLTWAEVVRSPATLREAG